MSSGTYIGFDYQLSFLYFGVGFACSIWSLCIFATRSYARKALKEQQKAERRQRYKAEQAEKAEQATKDNLVQDTGSAA